MYFDAKTRGPALAVPRVSSRSVFHLFAQEARHGLGQLLIMLLQRGVILPQQQHDAAHQITLIKSTNGMAVTAFIMSFFSVIPLVGFLPFLFGIIGFFKAKKCRSGRVMSVISLLITLACTAAHVWLAYFLINNPEALQYLFG